MPQFLIIRWKPKDAQPGEKKMCLREVLVIPQERPLWRRRIMMAIECWSVIKRCCLFVE